MMSEDFKDFFRMDIAACWFCWKTLSNDVGDYIVFVGVVQEAANSLDVNVRKSITDFVDGIEEILLEKMRVDVH